MSEVPSHVVQKLRLGEHDLETLRKLGEPGGVLESRSGASRLERGAGKGELTRETRS